MLLNLFFVSAVVYSFRTRQKLKELAANAENTNESSETESLLESVKMEVTTPNQAPNQIVEKNLSLAPKMLSVAERYDQAEGLLAKGVKIQDVASATGLSVSELRLLEKISTKSH